MPFSVTEFLAVFESYNRSIWPVQIAVYGLAALVVLAALKSGRAATLASSIVLALMWSWTGIVYHIFFFSEINPAAFFFGAGFVLQGVLFAATAASSTPLVLELKADGRSVAALSAIAYAMFIYPALGNLAGHGGMQGPMFGVTPCPLTIFTLGMFLLYRPCAPSWLLILPTLWALIGTGAAVSLGFPEDYGLPLSALLAATLILHDRRGRSRHA